VEQDRLLLHDRDLRAQARLRDCGDVLSVDQDASAIHVVQALDQLHERGLAGAGEADQPDLLARAFLADAPILVLDEATSSLDSESEALIQEATERLMQGRTTIVIAHRLSTVRHAHRIHVLEGGRVIEAGTHEELLDIGGLYAALWRVQTGDAAYEAS
jgi:ATP-binding cassette subfamily B protein